MPDLLRSRKKRYMSKKGHTQRRRRKRRSSWGGRGGRGGGGGREVTTPREKTTPFQPLTCSPLSEEYKHGSPVAKHPTCLPKEKILEVQRAWNKAYPSSPVTSKDPMTVWKQIQSNLKGVCNNDLCILNQPFVKHVKKTTTLPSKSSMGGKEQGVVDLTEYYAPKMPKEWKKNPNEWLSNIEMMEKMKPYEEAYPCFEFIGPTTIDFDKVLSNNQCVEKELCHFQLSNYLRNGTKKIGIIFNTDPHNKGGSHWISLFINIPKKMIFFFDSAGDQAPKEVMTFVNRVIAQGLALTPPIKFKFDQNYPNEHQYSTTECGMYSLYFIINMLEDKLTAEYLKNHVITDQMMMDYRHKYFNEI
jgi:hypothetical protein